MDSIYAPPLLLLGGNLVYPVMDPTVHAGGYIANATVTNNGLTVTYPLNQAASATATVGLNSGRHRFEVRRDIVGDVNDSTVIGLTDSTGAWVFYAWPYASLQMNSWTPAEGNMTHASSSWTLNTVIGVGVDFDAKTVTLSRNGTVFGTRNLGGAVGTLRPAIARAGQTDRGVSTETMNFGTTGFWYPAENYEPWAREE